MSAHVLDMAHFDYLVQAVERLAYTEHGAGTIRVRVTQEDVEKYGLRNVRTRSAWGGETYLEWEPHYDKEIFGRLLLAENVESVQARYPDGAKELLPNEEWTYNRQGIVEPNPRGTLGAIAGWRYQSCEHPDHEQGLAWRTLDVLERRVITDLADGNFRSIHRG